MSAKPLAAEARRLSGSGMQSAGMERRSAPSAERVADTDTSGMSAKPLAAEARRLSRMPSQGSSTMRRA